MNKKQSQEDKVLCYCNQQQREFFEMREGYEACREMFIYTDRVFLFFVLCVSLKIQVQEGNT